MLIALGVKNVAINICVACFSGFGIFIICYGECCGANKQHTTQHHQMYKLLHIFSAKKL